MFTSDHHGGDCRRWPSVSPDPGDSTAKVVQPSKVSDRAFINITAYTPMILVEAIDKAVRDSLADKTALEALDKIGLRAFYHDAEAMKARVEKERVETAELWSRS